MTKLPARPPGMTDLQARFCEEYLIDLNGKAALIRAGSKVKSDVAARVGATEFMALPHVQEYIQALQAARSERTKIDADWLLTRLAAEVDADIAELYDEFGALRPVNEWPLMFRKGLIQGVDVEEEFAEIDDPDQEPRDFDDPRPAKKIRRAIGRTVKIKLSDRAKRLEMIGRHIGVQAFKENVSLSGSIGVTNIPMESLTETQLEALASIPLKKTE